MLHYKAFTSDMTNGDLAELEMMVNAWLQEAQPLVHTMTQSACGASTIVSFLYESEDDELSERHAVATEEISETAGASLPQPALSDSLMITLLPQMELPY